MVRAMAIDTEYKTYYEKKPYEVYVSKPNEDGLKFLTRMDDEGIRKLLITETALEEGQRETFVETLHKARVAVTEKCLYENYILVVINKEVQP